MVEYHRKAWKCPKCECWHKVRGIGKKIRRCSCGYKIIIRSGYIEHTYLVSEIYDIEEIK